MAYGSDKNTFWHLPVWAAILKNEKSHFWSEILKEINEIALKISMPSLVFSTILHFLKFSKWPPWRHLFYQILQNCNVNLWVGLFLESFIKIGLVLSPNGSGHIDTHTDRQTHTHTYPGKTLMEGIQFWGEITRNIWISMQTMLVKW